MTECISVLLTGRRSAIALVLMGIAVSILPARSAGAVGSVSQMVSPPAAAPISAQLAPVSMAAWGGGGGEEPELVRAGDAAEAGQQCTVKFQHTLVGIGESLSLSVLVLEHDCSNVNNAYVVLGDLPYGGAEEGVDYEVSPRRIYLDDTDGTGSWSFRIFDDDIYESEEGAYVFFDTLSSGVTAVAGSDTARININDNDDPSNTVPNNPQSLSGDPGDRRVTLSWTPPSNTGGSAIRRYEYRYAVATASYPESWRMVSGGANARSVTVSNLNNGTTYKFQVRAVNGVGPGSPAETSAMPTAGGGGTPSLRINDVTVGEAAGTARLTVTLSASSSEVVRVGWATANASAQSGSDYTAGSGTLTFAPNTTTQQITVSIIDDTDEENTESFTVGLSNAQGATIADATGQITINANDGGTTTNRPSAPRSLGADPGDGQVRLSWTAPASNGGATITRYEYRHAGGSDPFPANWTPVSGGSGATQVTVTPLTNGTTYRFQVRAVNSAGGGDEAETTARPVDATATPSLAVPDVTVGEGDGTAVVRVTLAPAASQMVTVAYATSNGSATAGEDYTAADGTLTFTAGTVAREIRVAITDDTDGEGNENFTVTLSGAHGAGISRASGQVTIRDNDGTTTVEAPGAPQALVADEGDGEIELSWSPPASDGGAEIVRYEYRWAAGSDPLPDDWTVVSDGADARSVKITGLENDVPHRFHVRAVNEAGGGGEAQEAATPQDTGGGEPPSLSIDYVSVGEGSGAAVLRVTMSEESDGAVTVRYATSDGSAIAGPDYTAADGTLTLDAGTTAVEISISIRDDSEEEDNETFTVTLSSAQGANIEDGAGQVTILDNDGTATPEVPGAPRSLVADPRDGEVALSWAVPGSDGGSAVTRYEYRYATGSGSFPETWTVVSGGAGAREVTVGDLDNGTRYRFRVRAVNGVGEGEPAEASATPRDPADAPGLTMDNPTVNEDDGVAVLVVTLSPASDQAVTVRYATVNGSATAGQDYTASSGALRFNAGETTQEIRVPIIDDGDEEATESFHVRLSDPTNAVVVVGTGQVTIRDDEFGEGADPPSAPRDLVGVGEHRRVTLTWLEPESDGGAEVTHFEYRFVEGSMRFPSVWTPMDGGRRVRRLRLGQLVNGVTYRFQVRAVNPVGAGPSAQTDGMPVHPDSTPTFTIQDADVGEADGEATLIVTVSPPRSTALTVSYATADGSATAGEDYTETSGRLTFAPRVTRQTITVPILDDEEEEGDETLTVNLSLGGSQDARIGQGTGVVTIRDDEGDRVLTPPGPPMGLFGVGGDSLVTLYWSPPESDGGAAITHYEYRYAEVGKSFRVRWTGIVGQGRARQLTINGLENGTLYRFQVWAVNRVGPGELAETRATPGEEGTRPGVSVDPQMLEMEEGDSAGYTIVLDTEPFANVTVRMTADLSDTDLEVEPTEVVFTPSNWDEPRTILVRSAVDDDLDDDLGILLTHGVSGGGYDGFGVPSVTVDVTEKKVRVVPTLRAESARGMERPDGELVFFVGLTNASESTVSVEYATADGTAVAGQDYEERSGTLIFLPGTVTQGIAVPLVNDGTHEDVETFRLELFNVVNANLDAGDRIVLTGTIEDDDDPFEVSFEAAGYRVDEGGGVSVVAVLNRRPDHSLEIPIAVVGGPGVETGDFSVAPSVSFGRGQRRVNVRFSAVEDAVDEEDEVVTLTLGPNMPEGVVGVEPTTTEVTITDDDERGVMVSTEALEVLEGASAGYTIRLTSQPTGPVTVTVEGVPGDSDVAANPAVLSFAAQNWREAQTVTVSAAHDNDAIDEPQVALSHTVAGADYADVTAGGVTVTVVEDDTPALSMADSEATESEGAVIFEAVLDIRSSREVRVDYTTEAGSATENVDYSGRQGTLVFAPLQTTARLVVPVIDDNIDEPVEQFGIAFRGFVNAEPAGDSLSVTGTILDDDLPVLSITAVGETVAEGTDARFRLHRAADLTVPMSVAVTVTETEEFLAGTPPETVQFAIGVEEVILALPTVDDPLDERDGMIEVTVAESEEYEISGSPTARLTVTDNDATPALIVTGARAAESAGEMTFPVTLRGASAYEVTVQWLTANQTARAGEDYVAAAGRVTFAPGETAGEIRVAILDDLLPEEAETFSVTLSNPTNAVLEAGTATGTITDDDELVTQAWLSRFGRTVASQVVEGIGARLADGGGGGSLLNTAGAAAALSGDDGRGVGMGDLLDGSAFRFSQGSDGQEGAVLGGWWTAWGRGMGTRFDGADAGLSVEGSVLTGLAGVDYERGPILAGIAVSHSLGEGSLAKTAPGTSRELTQDVESTLSSAYPYLRINFTDRVAVWGLGGYGRGNMMFPDFGAENETGIEMNMGAFGARADLLNPESGLNIALESDAFLVRMSTDPGTRTESVDADASRIRFMLEAGNRMPVGASGVFAPMVEVGVRRDGGDAETGTGVEVGGGFRYANEAWGLSIEGSARKLVSHQDTTFSEWGAGGTLVFQPGGRERGLSVRMTTSWGAAAGSAEDLWSPYAAGHGGACGRRGAVLDHGPGGRLTAQLHYAMSPFGDGLTMAPYTEIGLAGDERGTSSRVGWRFDVMESLKVSLETNVGGAKSAKEGRGLVLRGRLLR